MGKCLHVLDVLRKNLLLLETMPNRDLLDLDCVRREKGQEIIRSATELKEAGIQLKKSETRCVKDISFADGVLRLPVIMVDDCTGPMFLNLMTFERFHFGAGNKVTAYIFFMDNIIDTEQDIALLRTQGIIQNFLGSNKEVADLFNSLTKDMTVFLDEGDESVQKKITEHCEKSCNMWRANLMHTYFRNPWSILSLIAALFLFALTIIQTVYSVLGNYK
ncbi:putative UPF0481 protein At3g02645 [Syzygium oleosum]|uniref:putative UPF0481 protein At3g02645 n=1 Tax=Syzygium oleosum TaxID=219896 RepID=UPI0011D1FD16|nr:putative UPF0481 protein At3g02645 [Syzygium oleosum]